MGTYTGQFELNDVITPTFVSPLVAITGAPTPGAGSDLIQGGGGNDTLDGGGGADTIQGGAGADLIHWAIGGGSDVIDGGSDSSFDLLSLTGDDARGDAFTFSASGTHVAIHAPSGADLDVDNMDAITLTPLHGSDSVTINDLRGTHLGNLSIGLGIGAGQLGDGQADTVTVNGGEGGVDLRYSRGANSIFSDDAARPAISFAGFEATDKLVINGGTGADVLGDQVLGSGPTITLNGLSGDDTLMGGPGDVLNGGAGDDTIFIGQGSEVVDGGANNDSIAWSSFQGADAEVVRGGAGFDTFAFDGGGSHLGLTSGGHALLTGVDGATANLAGIERIELLNFTGPMDIGDLSATEVQQVVLNLGGIDNSDDVLQITGGAGANQITVAAAFDPFLGDGVVQVFGLTAAAPAGGLSDIEVQRPGSHLSVQVDGGDGADVINVTSDLFTSPLIVRGGRGNDTITAGHFDADGHHLLGDAGNDFIDAGTGGLVEGGTGNDTLTDSGGTGYIFNRGDVGSDLIIGFHAHDALAPDRIILHGAADQSFSQAVANHHIFQSGGDVVVSEGVGLVLTLQATSLSSLNAGDFLFG